jgi:type I restriction enzyme R subunit
MDMERRDEVVLELEKRGIEIQALAEAAKQPEADPFDLLCHLAFQAPLRTRKERAARLRNDPSVFFGKFSTEAREVLDALLDKYSEHGTEQFVMPDILAVPPISHYGSFSEIVGFFGGVQQLRSAVSEMQRQLYAA